MSHKQNVSPEILKKDEKEEIINKISKIVRDNYVYPELGNKLGDHILEALNDGSFSDQTSKEDFSNAVVASLEEIVVDKHNRVLARGSKTEKYFEMAESLEEMMTEMHRQGGDQGQGTSGPVRRIVRRSESSGANDGTSDKPERVEIKGMTPRNLENFESGIKKIEIFSKNVGYLKINAFESTGSPDKQNMIDALSNLSSTDHLIIDLRDCRGGDGIMVNFVQGFLFGVTKDETIVLTETYMRPYDHTMKSIPEPWKYSESYRGKPVYLLISSSTGSAAEAFTFGFKNHNRGIIIGETTGGAGHPTSFHLVHPDILFMCSIGRTYDPNTNKGWEAIGIKPHIEIDKVQALDKALELINN